MGTYLIELGLGLIIIIVNTPSREGILTVLIVPKQQLQRFCRSAHQVDIATNLNREHAGWMQ